MNMNLDYWSYKRLRDVFYITRANKQTEYPAGTILVQVSATRGQTIYLDNAQKVADGSKYATLTVKDQDKYNAKYLYYILEGNLPDIVRKVKSGINLQMSELSDISIPVHKDINTQNAIATLLDMVEKRAEIERKTVELLQKHKDEMISKMMV